MTSATAIHHHPAEILQELIRFDTINLPGNDFLCIPYLDGLLTEAGFASSCCAWTNSPDDNIHYAWITRKVRLILGPHGRVAFGIRCFQKCWVAPRMSSRLPCVKSILCRQSGRCLCLN